MSSRTHRVAILVYDRVKLLDVAGPAEVFGEANLLGADYRIALVSPTGADVTSSIGMRIAVDAGAAEEPDPDTFLMPGGDVYPRTPVTRDLAEAAADLAGRAGRIAAVCSGAFVLGATGLLDGKRATTHWKIAGELAARHPKAHVEPDAIYVRDGATYTSAGVTAGIDLALALVEEDHGPHVSREVARSLVVYLHRADGQSQFSAPLQGPAAPVARPAQGRRPGHGGPRRELLPRRARRATQRQYASPHQAVPREAGHHPGPLRRVDPLRHREVAPRPGVHRDADGIHGRLPELREPAPRLRTRAGHQSRRLPAPLRHRPPRTG